MAKRGVALTRIGSRVASSESHLSAFAFFFVVVALKYDGRAEREKKRRPSLSLSLASSFFCNVTLSTAEARQRIDALGRTNDFIQINKKETVIGKQISRESG